MDYLKSEKKLYNFFRGINYNPSFITSSDQGETWGEPTHLIIDEVEGRNRPYARYCGDGLKTIHISFTDAHPRDFGNSIYYRSVIQIPGSIIIAVFGGWWFVERIMLMT